MKLPFDLHQDFESNEHSVKQLETVFLLNITSG